MAWLRPHVLLVIHSETTLFTAVVFTKVCMPLLAKPDEFAAAWQAHVATNYIEVVVGRGLKDPEHFVAYKSGKLGWFQTEPGEDARGLVSDYSVSKTVPGFEGRHYLSQRPLGSFLSRFYHAAGYGSPAQHTPSGFLPPNEATRVNVIRKAVRCVFQELTSVAWGYPLLVRLTVDGTTGQWCGCASFKEHLLTRDEAWYESLPEPPPEETKAGRGDAKPSFDLAPACVPASCGRWQPPHTHTLSLSAPLLTRPQNARPQLSARAWARARLVMRTTRMTRWRRRRRRARTMRARGRAGLRAAARPRAGAGAELPGVLHRTPARCLAVHDPAWRSIRH